MLELWGMRGTPLFPSLPGPLWLRVVAPDMSKKELNCKYAKLNCLKLTVFPFKCVEAKTANKKLFLY